MDNTAEDTAAVCRSITPYSGNPYRRCDTRTVIDASVSNRIRKSSRDLPPRLSVPVSDDDAAHLRRIQAKVNLPMSALSRLLFHRGIQAYLADGKLAD